MDVDLKVKDSFKVNEWNDEIYGYKKIKIKYSKPSFRSDAFFVFNDNDLNLQKKIF